MIEVPLKGMRVRFLSNAPDNKNGQGIIQSVFATNAGHMKCVVEHSGGRLDIVNPNLIERIDVIRDYGKESE